MSLNSLFNFGPSFRGSHLPPPDEGVTRHLQPQRVLRRVLDFTGHTIDDVINDPIARRKVTGYYKLHRWVDRGSEIGELERQWGV